jgi:hypothetical protein
MDAPRSSAGPKTTPKGQQATSSASESRPVRRGTNSRHDCHLLTKQHFSLDEYICSVRGNLSEEEFSRTAENRIT